MRRMSQPLLLVLVCAALVSGCTSKSQGEPAPAPTDVVDPTETSPESSPSEDDLPTDGAPAVENPLDTVEFQQDPCRALTSDQSTELNVGSTGKLYDGGLGNGCNWFNQETRGETDVVFLDKDPRGLSALYWANDEGRYVYFEKLPPINGYPAVSRDVVDNRSDGHCTVVVGASDEVAFETILQLSSANVGKKDPCEVAVQVASMALDTMKQGV